MLLHKGEEGSLDSPWVTQPCLHVSQVRSWSLPGEKQSHGQFGRVQRIACKDNVVTRVNGAVSAHRTSRIFVTLHTQTHTHTHTHMVKICFSVSPFKVHWTDTSEVVRQVLKGQAKTLAGKT